MVLELFKLNKYLDSYGDFSEGQLNANGLLVFQKVIIINDDVLKEFLFAPVFN